MKTNIILPIKNRAALAEQTLQSLYQNTPREDFDLRVYLDGPDPETKAMVIGLQKEYGFVLHENNESQGPGWCRNIFCKLLTNCPTKGDFLYHSDSDVYFKAGWLDALIKAYKAFPQVKLFGAGCHPYLETNLVLEKDGLTVHTKDAIPGFTAFMSWETWEQYGPYIEHKGIMGSEDWVFCQKIIKDGHYVASIVPELVVHCGKTNSDGNPATGSERMEQIEGIKIL